MYTLDGRTGDTRVEGGEHGPATAVTRGTVRRVTALHYEKMLRKAGNFLKGVNAVKEMREPMLLKATGYHCSVILWSFSGMMCLFQLAALMRAVIIRQVRKPTRTDILRQRLICVVRIVEGEDFPAGNMRLLSKV